MKLPFTSEAFAKGFLEGVKYVNDSSIDTETATITPVRDDLVILEFEDDDEDREDEDEESYPNGECPDCGDPIPDDATDGDECKNCGHVFVMQSQQDDPETENTVKAILYFSDEEGRRSYLAEKQFQDSNDPSESAALRREIEKELIGKNFDDRLYAASCSPVVVFVKQD
jgi:hypothetical protein